MQAREPSMIVTTSRLHSGHKLAQEVVSMSPAPLGLLNIFSTDLATKLSDTAKISA